MATVIGALLDQVMQMQFDDRTVEYDFADAPELTLAYAISVHRSQGSEYQAAVIPNLMLQRNLLDMSITRAKKLVVLVGSGEPIAIHNAKGCGATQAWPGD